VIPRLIALFLDKSTTEKISYQHKYCKTRDEEKVTDVFDVHFIGSSANGK
jgi:hypothetical protein